MYCKSSVIKTQRKRAAVASMFQNGISRNTKCVERDGFRREGHIFSARLARKILARLGSFLQDGKSKDARDSAISEARASTTFCLFFIRKSVFK